MSTNLQRALVVLQRSNCASLAIATAVGYDYVLTFPSEVEYVWNKPWSWVSFLFILVRYLGCFSAIATSLNGTIFIPEPGYAFYALNQFAFLFFIAAADVVMILRVWAMYSRSKLIIAILLTVFVPYMVLTTVVTVTSNIPGSVATTTVQVLDFSFCGSFATLHTWNEGIIILQLIPGGVTCGLVVIQFVLQSVQMYRATNQWQLNRYMNLLSRQGVLYFLVTLVFGLVNLPTQGLYNALGVKGLYSVLFVACNVPLFTLTPRFILSIRALYARDIRNRRGYGIDTGFGFSSVSNPGVCGTAMVFADIERNEQSEWDEETQIGGEEYT